MIKGADSERWYHCPPHSARRWQRRQLRPGTQMPSHWLGWMKGLATEHWRSLTIKSHCPQFIGKQMEASLVPLATSVLTCFLSERETENHPPRAEGVTVPIRHTQLRVSVSGKGQTEHKCHQHQQRQMGSYFINLGTEHQTRARAAPWALFSVSGGEESPESGGALLTHTYPPHALLEAKTN